MSNGESMAEAMAELAQSIRATPNNRRRLKSVTFWERLGCKRRTPERVQDVLGLLAHHSVSLELRHRGTMEPLQGVPFGSENRDDWIVLTSQASAPIQTATPAVTTQPTSGAAHLDLWFEKMAQLNLRSESDVVHKFISPMFEQLGYEEPDFAYEHPVLMRFGKEKFNKEADLVLFKRVDHVNDTHRPENALILAEAKKLGKIIDADVEGQARSYSMYLSPVYYVLSNGDDVNVYLYQIAMADDVPVMSCKRAELKQKWQELFNLICKQRVIEIKEKRRQIIAELQKL